MNKNLRHCNPRKQQNEDLHASKKSRVITPGVVREIFGHYIPARHLRCTESTQTKTNSAASDRLWTGDSA